jgi:hypothetical protein
MAYSSQIFPVLAPLGDPVQNKQGKNCVETLVRHVDKEEKIGVVVIISSLL